MEYSQEYERAKAIEVAADCEREKIVKWLEKEADGYERDGFNVDARAYRRAADDIRRCEHEDK